MEGRKEKRKMDGVLERGNRARQRGGAEGTEDGEQEILITGRGWTKRQTRTYEHQLECAKQTNGD